MSKATKANVIAYYGIIYILIMSILSSLFNWGKGIFVLTIVPIIVISLLFNNKKQFNNEHDQSTVNIEEICSLLKTQEDTLSDEICNISVYEKEIDFQIVKINGEYIMTVKKDKEDIIKTFFTKIEYERKDKIAKDQYYIDQYNIISICAGSNINDLTAICKKVIENVFPNKKEFYIEFIC